MKTYRYEQAEWVVYSVAFCTVMIGLGVIILAPMLPPWGQASASPEAIAQFYSDNNLQTRIGLACAMLGLPFLLPAFSLLQQIMDRELNMPILGSIQFGSGLAGLIFTFLMLCAWGTAAFRPDRAPEITQALHDLGWLIATWVASATMLQVLVIGLAVLKDTAEDPVLPRWYGYLELAGVVICLPAVVVNIFHTGPFAYDGLLGFWVPYVGLAVAFAALMVVLWPAVKKLQAAEAA